MPPKKRDTPFQAHHVNEFGLRICERAVGNSTAAATTACRFCEVFRKEESEVGMKRGRSERVKYFKTPFRKENYSSHHRRMHSTQWAEYRELEPSAKKSFSTLARSPARRQRCIPLPLIALPSYVS
jgi:hypothetical protein